MGFLSSTYSTSINLIINVLSFKKVDVYDLSLVVFILRQGW